MCDGDNDNAFKIENIELRNHDDVTSTEGECVSGIQHEGNLSIDDIEPSILTEAEENSHEIPCVSQSAKDVQNESHYKKQYPVEESFEEPSQNSSIGQYSSAYNSSENNYYFPTSFCSNMYNNYLRSSHMYTKFNQPEFIHNFTGQLASQYPYFARSLTSSVSFPPEHKTESDYLHFKGKLVKEDMGFEDNTKTAIEINNSFVDFPVADQDNDTNHPIDVGDNCTDNKKLQTLTKNKPLSYFDSKLAGNKSNDIGFLKDQIKNEYDKNDSICTSVSSKQISNTEKCDTSSKLDNLVVNDEGDNTHLQNTALSQRYNKCGMIFQKNLSEDASFSSFSACMLASRSSIKSYETYSCTECNYSSCNRSNFKNHLLIHSEKKSFSCKYCPYRGKQSAGLRAHMKVHSVEKPFICYICNHRCKRKQNLIQHLRVHSKGDPFPCTYCDYKTTTKKALQNHMMKHVDENCDARKEEPKTYLSEVQDVHIKNKIPISQFSNSNATLTKSLIFNCFHCSFSTKRKCAFKNHLKKHKECYLSCCFCDYNCGSQEKLNAHITASHKMYGPKCEIPNIKIPYYPVIKEFQAHPNQEIPTDDNKHLLQCPYCNFECNTPKSLKFHISDHPDEDFFNFTRLSCMTKFEADDDKTFWKNKSTINQSRLSSSCAEQVKPSGVTSKGLQYPLSSKQQHKKTLNRRGNPFYYLNWDFTRNKYLLGMKNESLGKKFSSKIRKNIKTTQTSRNLKALEKQFAIDFEVSDTNSQTVFRKSAHSWEKKSTNIKLSPIEQTDSEGDLVIDESLAESKGIKKVFEDENDVRSNLQLSSTGSRFTNNDFVKTSNDQEDDKKFCGFVNDAMQKNNEFATSFNDNFDPLHISTPFFSISTPRSDVDPDSSDNTKPSNYQDEAIKLSTENHKQECNNSKENETEKISILDLQRSDPNKNDTCDDFQEPALKEEQCHNIFVDTTYFMKKDDKFSNSLPFTNITSGLLKQKKTKPISNSNNKFQETCISPINERDTKANFTHNTFQKEIKEAKTGVTTQCLNECKIFRCTICGSSFLHKSAFSVHMQAHKNNAFKCSMCPVTFIYRRALSDHEKRHVKEKKFKCPECGFSSSRKCSLMSHRRCHRKKFKCVHCNFECRMIKRMEEHYLKHKHEREGQPRSSRSRNNAAEKERSPV